MAIDQETEFLSLAALADLVTDEIEVLTSRIPDEGVYRIRGQEVSASETRNEDEVDEKGNPIPPLFHFSYSSIILNAEPLRKDKAPDSYIGRTLRERITLWPRDFEEGIGLLKGRYKLVGLPYSGRMGGVEDKEPGWIDGFVGHEFDVRVRHRKNRKTGDTNAYYDWLEVKAGKRQPVDLPENLGGGDAASGFELPAAEGTQPGQAS